MLQSGFINNANALKSKSYLDTLSQRQLWKRPICYPATKQKFGYDDLLKPSGNAIRQIVTGETWRRTWWMLHWKRFWRSVRSRGVPKPEDLPQYPAAYSAAFGYGGIFTPS